MMSVEADAKFCANCVMHNWKQPDDKSSLKPCRGCRKILYCDKACRKEHWEKVHKNHCQSLAVPTMCPESQHDAESCAICRPAAGTGKGKITMAGRDRKRNQASFSYECITKDMHFASGLASPHPFPVAGARDDLLEKSIIVVQNLVLKLRQNPRVAMTCSAELEQMERFLWSKRKEIWRHRKLYSHPKIVYMALKFRHIRDLDKSITSKLSQGKAGKDASELWKIFKFVVKIIGIIATYHQQEALKNPIDSMPAEFRDLVKLSCDNKFDFLDIAEDIIDSLLTQVLPYEDIVKKLCGGKKRQNCSFCGVKIEVTECFGMTDKKCSSVSFDSISIKKYSCDSTDCLTKVSSRLNDRVKLCLALATACNEREGTRCDFCFQLCPIDEVHRCCVCFTVMYCSKSCHKKDKEEHSKKYCIEDERKTKEDSSMRRQRGEITQRKMAYITAGSVIEKNEAVINEALEAFQFKDSKKCAGDNPDTEREHATSLPKGATVPTAQDYRSKAGTGNANTEHVNDRAANNEHVNDSIRGAGTANTEHVNDSIRGAGTAYTEHVNDSTRGAGTAYTEHVNDRAANTEHVNDSTRGAGTANNEHVNDRAANTEHVNDSTWGAGDANTEHAQGRRA